MSGTTSENKLKLTVTIKDANGKPKDLTLEFDDNRRGRDLYTIYNPETPEAIRKQLTEEIYGPRREDCSSEGEYTKRTINWYRTKGVEFSSPFLYE